MYLGNGNVVDDMTWTDPKGKRIGEENRDNTQQALSTLAILPFTRRLNMSIQEVRALVASACVDAANPDLKAYFPLSVPISSASFISSAKPSIVTSASEKSLCLSIDIQHSFVSSQCFFRIIEQVKVCHRFRARLIMHLAGTQSPATRQLPKNFNSWTQEKERTGRGKGNEV